MTEMRLRSSAEASTSELKQKLTAPFGADSTPPSRSGQHRSAPHGGRMSLCRRISSTQTAMRRKFFHMARPRMPNAPQWSPLLFGSAAAAYQGHERFHRDSELVNAGGIIGGRKGGAPLSGEG